MSDNVSVSGRIQKMKNLNFKERKGKKNPFMCRKQKRKMLRKCLISTCNLMHKMPSKKHASMLIMQQMRILRIRNRR